MTTTTDIERPPGPNLSTLAALRAFRSDRIGLLERTARDYGDIAYVRLGRFHVYLLGHPDYVKDVLVTHSHRFMKGQTMQEAKRMLGESLLTSEGEVHKRRRRLIQPIFHHERITGYGEVMVAHGTRTADRWVDGARVDMHREMTGLTLSIVGEALFGTDIEDADARAVGDAMTVMLSMFGRLFSPFAAVLERLPLPSNRRFLRAQELLDRTIYRMIAERRARGATGDDLLSMLLRAQDVEGDGGGMNDGQVRDEAMTLFLAGHETTANALAWTWQSLSENQEAEAGLHAELDRVLDGRPPTAADIPNLPFTDMVVLESMRVRPPAWAIGRRTLVDHEVGGYLIPEGSIVVVSPYVMHHDARWYPEPAAFRPERWTAEERAARPRYSYFPFGAGPRQCIGESFARMEAVLLIATLAQRWRMRPVPGHPVGLDPVITLRPKNGMPMTLQQRPTARGAA